jgi:hypothetical protein
MGRTSDKATALRKEIKDTLGYNSRQVGVKVSPSLAIRVTVKDKSIPIEPIEAIAETYENYTRDERSQEILAGGNTFVFVNYDWRLN